VSLIFLGLWEFHYLYRSVVYPLLMRDSGGRNMPVLIMLMAIVYNCANGYVNGYHLFVTTDVYSLRWLADPRFVLGVTLFAAGFVVHVWSDGILRRLRATGAARYGIPRGGLFRYVSCPNYLGEIVQWCGFALATWSLAGLSFAVFTVANLLPRALSYHRWYRETFPEYPDDRRALIPAIL
jgi:protein-S-isoprenylcysteine O-methyltransferase Ste14